MSEGGIVLPKETVWWLEGYERERENKGAKSSKTVGDQLNRYLWRYSDYQLG